MEICGNLDLNDLDGEIWKEIEEYDGDYQVSNLGRVKSFKKWNGTDVRILKQNKDDKGYFRVCLYKNGEQKPIRIYTLMVENHIGKIQKGCVVHHIDENKENDFLENFQVMTKGEHLSKHNKGENNPNYGKRPSEETLELMSENQKKGENHPRSTLTEQKVIEIKFLLKEGILNGREIGEKFGVCRMTISKIKLGKLWKHIKVDHLQFHD